MLRLRISIASHHYSKKNKKETRQIYNERTVAKAYKQEDKESSAFDDIQNQYTFRKD
jgi:hypothetical protein